MDARRRGLVPAAVLGLFVAASLSGCASEPAESEGARKFEECYSHYQSATSSCTDSQIECAGSSSTTPGKISCFSGSCLPTASFLSCSGAAGTAWARLADCIDDCYRAEESATREYVPTLLLCGEKCSNPFCAASCQEDAERVGASLLDARVKCTGACVPI